jgi:hypothetical protein
MILALILLGATFIYGIDNHPCDGFHTAPVNHCEVKNND